MIIKLSPRRFDEPLSVVKAGDTLIINGESFDFSPLPEGGTLPVGAITSQWFAADPYREAGQLVITLTLPNPINYSPEQAFPVDLVNVPDGIVAFPQPLPELLNSAEVSPE